MHFFIAGMCAGVTLSAVVNITVQWFRLRRKRREIVEGISQGRLN